MLLVRSDAHKLALWMPPWGGRVDRRHTVITLRKTWGEPYPSRQESQANPGITPWTQPFCSLVASRP